MTFYKEGLLELESERQQAEQARRKIVLRAGRVVLHSDAARRVLYQGALRRLKMIHHCTALIFELIPPNTNRPPPERSISLVTICLQSHFIHVFGFIDCLAHLWVLEKGLTQSNGKAIPRTKIGLGRNNDLLRSTLPAETLAKIEEFDNWFEYLEMYRHSLAHRIPLYIPPNFVDPKNATKYSALNEAWLTELDDKESERLQKEMDQISHFKSIALFDLDEAPCIFFHPQVIADRKTIEVIASAVFDALEKT
jgi:hypothetical protein